VIERIHLRSGSEHLVVGALTGAVVWVGMGATGTLTYSIFNGPPLGSWLLFSLYGLIVYATGAPRDVQRLAVVDHGHQGAIAGQPA